MVFYIIAATLHGEDNEGQMEQKVESVLKSKVLGNNADARRNNEELYSLEVNKSLPSPQFACNLITF